MQVNPKGGAIALGHPLGATGARMMATLMPELKKNNFLAIYFFTKNSKPSKSYQFLLFFFNLIDFERG